MSDSSLFGDALPEAHAPGAEPYRVLARKYRPTDFEGLVGQEALVKTLSNAIAMNRIAHAFLLTGIRGIGKTTTARIIARALNCVGEDGNGGPTIKPCGVCEHCKSIAADRHVDVIEMDAASRTGVNDIREIIETVQYRPASARYKIYIIDEVHMLSNSAFNALLKTLEEPPPHVKFIFATTEIRKVPVTVLSRCQRFDLKRIDQAMLQQHLHNICEQEGVTASEAALALIARAAEGSVRDSLSLLDQVIAHAEGKVEAEQVQQMIGLADRTRLFVLFEQLMEGQVTEALATAQLLYKEGSDPSLILSDLMDVAHFISRVAVDKAAADDPAVPQAEQDYGRKLAEMLALPQLTRAWQTMLKGMQELQQAPHPLQALEMVLIRLGYMAELPPPAELVRVIREQRAGGGSGGVAGGSHAGASGRQPVVAASSPAPVAPTQPVASRGAGGANVIAMRRGAAAQAVALQPTPEDEAQALPQAMPQTVPMPESFEAMVALFADRREPVLHQQLRQQVRVISYEPGRLAFASENGLSDAFAGRVSHCLKVWTGKPWLVVLENDENAGADTLAAKERDAWETEKAALAKQPHIAKILQIFPGAEIASVVDMPSQADTNTQTSEQE